MNYEVNTDTLAVIPSGDNRCKVVENKRTYNINKSSLKVIEHSCEYFGVSLRSRIESSYRYVKTRYKTPIIIEEASRLVFFPISSVRSKNTIWINYNNILEYYKSHVKDGFTTIRFINGFKMDIPVSFYSFNNQYLKASRLRAALSERIYRKL